MCFVYVYTCMHNRPTRPGVSDFVVPSVFSTKLLYAFLISATRFVCCNSLVLSNLITQWCVVNSTYVLKSYSICSSVYNWIWEISVSPFDLAFSPLNLGRLISKYKYVIYALGLKCACEICHLTTLSVAKIILLSGLLSEMQVYTTGIMIPTGGISEEKTVPVLFRPYGLAWDRTLSHIGERSATSRLNHATAF
jgi:hypothetical protein